MLINLLFLVIVLMVISCYSYTLYKALVITYVADLFFKNKLALDNWTITD